MWRLKIFLLLSHCHVLIFTVYCNYKFSDIVAVMLQEWSSVHTTNATPWHWVTVEYGKRKWAKTRSLDDHCPTSLSWLVDLWLKWQPALLPSTVKPCGCSPVSTYSHLVCSKDKSATCCGDRSLFLICWHLEGHYHFDTEALLDLKTLFSYNNFSEDTPPPFPFVLLFFWHERKH